MAVFHRRQHLGKDYFMEHVLDVKKLVNELTLEEKASLCSGADFWHTKAIDRLNIPAAMVSDGPARHPQAGKSCRSYGRCRKY